MAWIVAADFRMLYFEQTFVRCGFPGIDPVLTLISCSISLVHIVLYNLSLSALLIRFLASDQQWGQFSGTSSHLKAGALHRPHHLGQPDSYYSNSC